MGTVLLGVSVGFALRSTRAKRPCLVCGVLVRSPVMCPCELFVFSNVLCSSSPPHPLPPPTPPWYLLLFLRHGGISILTGARYRSGELARVGHDRGRDVEGVWRSLHAVLRHRPLCWHRRLPRQARSAYHPDEVCMYICYIYKFIGVLVPSRNISILYFVS